jgi:hypothetical protein
MSRLNPVDVYRAHLGAVLEHVARRRGMSADVVDFRTPDAELLEREFDELRDQIGAEKEDVPRDLRRLKKMSPSALMGEVLRMQEERDAARLDAMKGLMRFLYGGGPDPVRVAERATVLARTMADDGLWGMKQWEAGALFGDIRQTWREKEKRMIEQLVTKYTSVKYTNAGGKSVQARVKQSLARMGNTSKKFGRRKGDHRDDVVPDAPEISAAEERRQLDELRREEERERIAELAGVDPEEVDLDQTFMSRDDD